VRGQSGPASEVDEEEKDVFHALVSVVLPAIDSDRRLLGAQAVYKFIRKTQWGDGGGDALERLELLRQTAVVGFSAIGITYSELAKTRGRLGDASGRECEIEAGVSIPSHLSPHSELMNQFDSIYRSAEFDANALTEAASLINAARAIPCEGLFDDKPLCLAELARMEAYWHRTQGRWDDLEACLQRAEVEFAQTLEPETGYAKVAYSRLANLYHRFQFSKVAASAKPLAEIFRKLGVPEYAVKCAFVEGMALKALDQFEEALRIFQHLADDADVKRLTYLFVRVHTQLADCCFEMGRPLDAQRALREASLRLPKNEISISSADFQLICGAFLRSEGYFEEARSALIKAKSAALATSLQGSAAYAAVMIAETDLLLGQTEEAVAELLWALPLLEEHGMLPMERAAVALLQKSIRRRQLDPMALRELTEQLRRPQ